LLSALQSEAEEAVLHKKRSKKTEKKYKSRQKHAKVDPAVEEQFMAGRVLGKSRNLEALPFVIEHHVLVSIPSKPFMIFSFPACIASRPGQCGRADGYVLEGKELEFYLKKIKSKKAK
jgi:small subunit ribosomal protein S8e